VFVGAELSAELYPMPAEIVARLPKKAKRVKVTVPENVTWRPTDHRCSLASGWRCGMTRQRRASPSEAQPLKRARGKQVTFDPQIAEEICWRMACGQSLRSICRDPGMPPESTVRWWHIYDHEGFAAQYARAREAQADCWASEIVDLADETLADANHVAKARLQIDARKWVASKLLPRKYSERVSAELTGANGAPIKTERQFPELKKMSDEDLLALREILLRRAAAEDEGEAAANG
jgi:hypothetical protein